MKGFKSHVVEIAKWRAVSKERHTLLVKSKYICTKSYTMWQWSIIVQSLGIIGYCCVQYQWKIIEYDHLLVIGWPVMSERLYIPIFHPLVVILCNENLLRAKTLAGKSELTLKFKVRNQQWTHATTNMSETIGITWVSLDLPQQDPQTARGFSAFLHHKTHI